MSQALKPNVSEYFHTFRMLIQVVNMDLNTEFKISGHGQD